MNHLYLEIDESLIKFILNDISKLFYIFVHTTTDLMGYGYRFSPTGLCINLLHCPPGQCCSKYGHCGTTEDYSSVEKGCQSEFGSCYSPANGKCGYGNGRCPEGYCCSQYGHCGKTEDHCSTAKGCQSKYGKCSDTKETRCGSGYGNCPSGYCCSQYGHCGKDPAYCGTGCQSAYGK